MLGPTSSSWRTVWMSIWNTRKSSRRTMTSATTCHFRKKGCFDVVTMIQDVVTMIQHNHSSCRMDRLLASRTSSSWECERTWLWRIVKWRTGSRRKSSDIGVTWSDFLVSDDSTDNTKSAQSSNECFRSFKKCEARRKIWDKMSEKKTIFSLKP